MVFPFFLAYVVLSFVYPGEIFPALAPYRVTYWVGVVGLAVATARLIVRPSPLKTPQLWLLAAFTGTLSLSLMVADRWLGAPLSTIQRFGPSLTMFVLAITGVTSIRKLRITAVCIAGVMLFVLAQGFAAYHFGYRANTFLLDPNATSDAVTVDQSLNANDDPVASQELDDEIAEDGVGQAVRIRGLGLFHDPNDLALAFVVALALVGGTWRSGATVRNTFLVAIPAMALGYGVFLTHSRGGTFAFLATLGLTFGRRLGKLRATLLVSVCLVAVLALNFSGGRGGLVSTDESAMGRITAWTEGFEMLKSHPLLGVGFGQFLDYHTLTAHNSFVLCFAETGLVGYFFWLGLLAVTFVQLRQFKCKSDEVLDRELGRWAGALQIALIGFLAAAFLLSRTFIPLLYLLIGMSVALVLIARQENRALPTPSIIGLGTLTATCEVVTILLIYTILKLPIA